MKTFKYIVTENEDGIEEIFIFPKAIDHDAFYENALLIDNSLYPEQFRFVTGAGFIDFDSNGEYRLYGRSETLNKDSCDNDRIVFERMN